MQYFITFLEGVITFISPCVLPLIPVYVLYFAGDRTEGTAGRALKNALGFVAGFTVVYMFMGVFAGTIGAFLTRHQTVVNIVSGAIVVLFGLHYTGLLRIGVLNKTLRPGADVKPNNVFSSALFGAVFAVGWSPCTGAFLGSALMLAASQTGWLMGMLLLLAYSLGLGVPFVLCAVLIDRLKNAFDWIRRHYRAINIVCGVFLVAVGVLMMTGVFSRWMILLA